MITIAPATGPNHTAILADIVLTAGSVAVSAGTLATEMAYVATQVSALVLKIETSNRAGAIGVKSLTAGTTVATNQAVLTRRNTLAGAANQFPVPPTPPTI
jgi:hypothetical protein